MHYDLPGLNREFGDYNTLRSRRPKVEAMGDDLKILCDNLEEDPKPPHERSNQWFRPTGRHTTTREEKITMSITVTSRDALTRAYVYRFLASLFMTHPTARAVRELTEMAEALRVPYPVDVSLDALDQEYMELFVVPNPRYVAPYESVYRDCWLMPSVLKRGSNPGEESPKIKGLVMGESTQAVRQSYVDSGVLPTKDLPDHIGNELYFLGYLSSLEMGLSAHEAELSAEQRALFCRNHLLTWIGDLRDKIAGRDRLGFYLAAIKVTKAVLEDDA